MARIYTRKEAKNRRLKYSIFAGMLDFVGTVGGALVIIACIVLVTALITWIASDAQVSFATIFDSIDRAIIRPTATPSW